MKITPVILEDPLSICTMDLANTINEGSDSKIGNEFLKRILVYDFTTTQRRQLLIDLGVALGVIVEDGGTDD